MTEITRLPALPEGTRPETGPMQFGEDRPGVFIRGDNALGYAMALAFARDRLKDLDPRAWGAVSILEGLLCDLRSCKEA